MNAREEQLLILSSLGDPLAAFFEEVFVMCDDVAVRNNRLVLLKCISDLMKEFAHIDMITSCHKDAG